MPNSGRDRIRRLDICALVGVLANLPSLAHCVSLADFSPSATNLSPSCEANAYTVTIPACTTSDFLPGNSCSPDCLSGLVYINQLVYRNCQSPQDYQLLIAEFRNGNGIEVLCPGVVVVTSKPSHPQPAQPTHSPKEPSTRISGTSIYTSKRPVETSGLITDSTKSPTPSYGVTNITPLTPSGKHTKTRSTVYVTSTSTHWVAGSTSTRTARSTKSSTKTSTTNQIVTDTSQSPSAPSSPAPTLTSTTDLASKSQALESKCVEYGGDPFSNCEVSDLNNTGSQPHPCLSTLLLCTMAIFALGYLGNS